MRRALKIAGAALALAALADAAWLWWIWPDWKAIAKGPVPRSRFLADSGHGARAH